MWRLTILFSLVFGFANAQAVPAASSQFEFNQQFKSSRISFLKPGDPYTEEALGKYPTFLRFFFTTFFSSVPTGEARAVSEKCDSTIWGRRLQDERMQSSAAMQGALVQKYLKDCDNELQTTITSSFRNSTRMMSMELSPKEHPFLQPVLFHLPGNVKLKGILGLKGDFKKRPLIVLRVGVFSNSSEFYPERAWMMMLFEQSPFNVLLVENMASSEFISHNSRFSFGGYDEGLQNILIAKILQDPNEPLNQLIDSLHLFGHSLGGHGMLFASLLNELNSPKGKPLYSSFFGMCPVVDLQTTMHEIVDKKPFGYFVDLWARARFVGLREKWSSVNDHPSFEFLSTAVSELVRTYQGGLSYVSEIKLPEGMKDSTDFWKLNDYWPYYKNVRQPVLVWSTTQDLIVPFNINSQKIMNKTLKLANSNVSVVEFKQGLHCTLPVAYNWKPLTSLMQSYFLSHSPGFQQEWQELKLELDEEASFLQYKLGSMKSEDKFIQLTARIRTKNGTEKDLKVNLPLSQFDFRFMNAALSVSEQQMIVRWIHQNLVMKVDSLEGKWFLSASWPVAR